MEGWRSIVRYDNYRLHMTGLDIGIGMFQGTGGIHVGILQPEEKLCHWGMLIHCSYTVTSMRGCICPGDCGIARPVN